MILGILYSPITVDPRSSESHLSESSFIQTTNSLVNIITCLTQAKIEKVGKQKRS